MYNPHTYDFSGCPSLENVRKTMEEYIDIYTKPPSTIYMNQRTLASYLISDPHVIQIAPERYSIYGTQVEYHDDYESDDVYVGTIEEELVVSEVPSIDMYFYGEIDSLTHVIIDRKMWSLKDISVQHSGDNVPYKKISYHRQVPLMANETQLNALKTFKLIKATLLKVGKEEE